jgi:hypothetical protein
MDHAIAMQKMGVPARLDFRLNHAGMTDFGLTNSLEAAICTQGLNKRHAP